MEGEPKHKITHVDVLVHPGYGAVKFPYFSGPLYESHHDYKSVVKDRQIDSKRFRKVLFGVWGGRIKEIARQKEKGLVIVPVKFEKALDGYGKKEAIKTRDRLIKFAEKVLGKERLVVIEWVETIQYNPKSILDAYIKRGLMSEYTQPDFVVYGEKSDVCVRDAWRGLKTIGRAEIDYSRTEWLKGMEKLKRKIIRRSAVRKKMPRRHGRWI